MRYSSLMVCFKLYLSGARQFFVVGGFPVHWGMTVFLASTQGMPVALLAQSWQLKISSDVATCLRLGNTHKFPTSSFALQPAWSRPLAVLGAYPDDLLCRHTEMLFPKCTRLLCLYALIPAEWCTLLPFPKYTLIWAHPLRLESSVLFARKPSTQADQAVKC